MLFSPHPGMHSAHGNAGYKLQMIDLQALSDKPMLRFDHVFVLIVRESRVHSVAGFAGFSMANAVRNDDEIAIGSSAWPGWNSAAKRSPTKLADDPPVPCSKSTALLACPAASCCRFPRVR